MEVEESSKGSQKEAKGKKTTLETKIREMTVIKNPDTVIYLYSPPSEKAVWCMKIPPL